MDKKVTYLVNKIVGPLETTYLVFSCDWNNYACPYNFQNLQIHSSVGTETNSLTAKKDKWVTVHILDKNVTFTVSITLLYFLLKYQILNVPENVLGIKKRNRVGTSVKICVFRGHTSCN